MTVLDIGRILTGLKPPNEEAVCEPVNEIHALETEFEHRVFPRSRSESSLKSAASDNEGTKNKDGVEEVEDDLAAGCEALKCGENATIVEVK